MVVAQPEGLQTEAVPGALAAHQEKVAHGAQVEELEAKHKQPQRPQLLVLKMVEMGYMFQPAHQKAITTNKASGFQQ